MSSDSASKNRFKRAVALGYNEDSGDSPWISVKGEMLVADELVDIAKRYNIPVVEEAGLAQALCSLDVDDQIPEELFEPVALILRELAG